MISSSSPQQIANQPITRQPLNALSHVDVKTTCWSSKREAEWGERGQKLWWTWLLVSDGQLVRVFHKLQGNPLGYLSHYNHLLGLPYVFLFLHLFFIKNVANIQNLPSSSPVTYSSGLTNEEEEKKNAPSPAVAFNVSRSSAVGNEISVADWRWRALGELWGAAISGSHSRKSW